MTKLKAAFRNFANAPKNWIHEETGIILNSENHVLPSATRHGNDHSKQSYEFATCLVRVWNPRGMKVYEHKKNLVRPRTCCVGFRKWVLHQHFKSVEINSPSEIRNYEGWNFNSGNYLFTTDTK